MKRKKWSIDGERNGMTQQNEEGKIKELQHVQHRPLDLQWLMIEICEVAIRNYN